MKKSTKITILEIVIALIIVAIALVFINILRKNKDVNDSDIIHTRLSVSSSSTTNSTSENIVTTESTKSSETTKSTSEKTTSSTTSKTTKETTKETTSKKTIKETTKKTTSEKTTSETTLKVTNSKTTYPNALDAWEWAIVRAINNERSKNGLNKLEVAVDLRRKAEEAADLWQHASNSELKNYLKKYNSYANWQNLLNETNGYNVFVKETLNNTSIGTKKDIKYIGVGVIFNEKGYSSLPTYYYVMIYQ